MDLCPLPAECEGSRELFLKHFCWLMCLWFVQVIPSRNHSAALSSTWYCSPELPHTSRGESLIFIKFLCLDAVVSFTVLRSSLAFWLQGCSFSFCSLSHRQWSKPVSIRWEGVPRCLRSHWTLTPADGASAGRKVKEGKWWAFARSPLGLERGSVSAGGSQRMRCSFCWCTWVTADCEGKPDKHVNPKEGQMKLKKQRD